MDKFIKPSRIAICAVFVLSLLVLYGFTLYNLQVVEGEEYLRESQGTTTVTRTISAARGNIYDRNGTLLVTDSAIYNVTIDRDLLLKLDEPNEVIRVLVKAAQDYGISYSDEFPVTKTAPFQYDAGATNSQMSYLTSYIEYFSSQLEPDITAPELISWMREHYGISYTVPAEEARQIIAVRYGLEIRRIVNMNDYIFAEDVTPEFISFISEQNFTCVNIEVSSEREYHTTYAAHILGVIGAVDRDEYNDTYKELGYSLNAQVGKSGAEKAFETYLHGVDGIVTKSFDADGAVTNVVTEREASAGGNVYLSIDIDLQAKTETALANGIAEINAERTGDTELAEGGAAVIVSVNTGEVLAMASYPTYDLSTYYRDYVTTSEDPLHPLNNRATGGLYNPGSTFKMVTAYAGLKEGVIGRWTEIEDKGIYTKYEGYQPRCWIYSSGVTHGYVNVVDALAQSCNYFFYYVGDSMDIDQLSDAARQFGFGSPTGIEIGESSGILATRENKIAITGETGWWSADSLITAIGQGLNEFTPIQIANYTACIANGGTLYSDTILRYVTNYDYSEVLLEHEPTVLNEIDRSTGYVSILQEGMRAVVTKGTASSGLSDYPVSVAAKTGTIQSSGTTMNNAVFVCYAPASNPEIAISIVVEKGGSGSALTEICCDLLDAYFSTTEEVTSVIGDNELVK